MTLTYCGNIVRQQDSDRFLLSLFAPAKCRAALWALFAFNCEIAKTREVVSDTTIGLIRLQWWRDAIAEIYEGKVVRKHEVVEPLAQAIKEYDLPRELFDKLIYAREFDLEDVLPVNVEGLMNYCDYTSTPLFTLANEIVNKSMHNFGGKSGNDTFVSNISKHYALIGAIRAVPYMLTQRRLLLPEDILKANAVGAQSLFDFKDKGKLPNVIKETLGRSLPYRNEEMGGVKLPKFLKRVAHMTHLYEAQIKSVHYDVFDARLSLPPRFFALRLWLGV